MRLLWIRMWVVALCAALAALASVGCLFGSGDEEIVDEEAAPSALYVAGAVGTDVEIELYMSEAVFMIGEITLETSLGPVDMVGPPVMGDSRVVFAAPEGAAGEVVLVRFIGDVATESNSFTNLGLELMDGGGAPVVEYSDPGSANEPAAPIVEGAAGVAGTTPVGGAADGGLPQMPPAPAAVAESGQQVVRRERTDGAVYQVEGGPLGPDTLEAIRIAPDRGGFVVWFDDAVTLYSGENVDYGESFWLRAIRTNDDSEVELPLVGTVMELEAPQLELRFRGAEDGMYVVGLGVADGAWMRAGGVAGSDAVYALSPVRYTAALPNDDESRLASESMRACVSELNYHTVGGGMLSPIRQLALQTPAHDRNDNDRRSIGAALFEYAKSLDPLRARLFLYECGDLWSERLTEENVAKRNSNLLGGCLEDIGVGTKIMATAARWNVMPTADDDLLSAMSGSYLDLDRAGRVELRAALGDSLSCRWWYPQLWIGRWAPTDGAHDLLLIGGDER